MIRLIRWLFGTDKDKPYVQDNPDYDPNRAVMNYRSFRMNNVPEYYPVFVPRENTNFDGREHDLRHNEFIWNESIDCWYVYDGGPDWFVKYSHWRDRQQRLDNEENNAVEAPGVYYDINFDRNYRRNEDGTWEWLNHIIQPGAILNVADVPDHNHYYDLRRYFSSLTDGVTGVGSVNLSGHDPDHVRINIDGYRYKLIRDDCEDED